MTNASEAVKLYRQTASAAAMEGLVRGMRDRARARYRKSGSRRTVARKVIGRGADDLWSAKIRAEENLGASFDWSMRAASKLAACSVSGVRPGSVIVAESNAAWLDRRSRAHRSLEQDTRRHYHDRPARRDGPFISAAARKRRPRLRPTTARRHTRAPTDGTLGTAARVISGSRCCRGSAAHGRE